jgi:hypothetical protein
MDPSALAVQVTRYRSAALIDASQAKARMGKLMGNTTPSPADSLDRGP